MYLFDYFVKLSDKSQNFSAVYLFDYFVKISDRSQVKIVGLFEKHKIIALAFNYRFQHKLYFMQNKSKNHLQTHMSIRKLGWDILWNYAIDMAEATC